MFNLAGGHIAYLLFFLDVERPLEIERLEISWSFVEALNYAVALICPLT